MWLRKSVLLMFCFLLVSSLVPMSAFASTKLVPDVRLEQVIRKTLNKPWGALTRSDMARLSTLNASGQKIRSLSGLQHAVNLRSLKLNNNLLRDISPLAPLRNLTSLELEKNEVKAICPAVGFMTRLQELNARDNVIENVSCMDKLLQLQKLQLSDNLISDITPLLLFSGTHIELSDNDIRDVSVMEAWDNVKNVYLANNPLEASNDETIFLMRRAGKLIDLENAYRIQVFVGKDKLAFNVPPIQTSGTTLVEFRPIFEKLGLSISFNAQEKKITGSRQGLTVLLNIGNRFATVNGQFRTMNVAPQIIDGVTMVPLRLIGEATGSDVSWNSFTRTIRIATAQEQAELVMQQYKQYFSTYNTQGIRSIYDSTFLRFFEMENETNDFYDNLIALNATFELTYDALQIVELNSSRSQAVVESVQTIKVIGRGDSALNIPAPISYDVRTTIRKNSSGMWLIVDETKKVKQDPTDEVPNQP